MEHGPTRAIRAGEQTKYHLAQSEPGGGCAVVGGGSSVTDLCSVTQGLSLKTLVECRARFHAGSGRLVLPVLTSSSSTTFQALKVLSPKPVPGEAGGGRRQVESPDRTTPSSFFFFFFFFSFFFFFFFGPGSEMDGDWQGAPEETHLPKQHPLPLGYHLAKGKEDVVLTSTAADFLVAVQHLSVPAVCAPAGNVTSSSTGYVYRPLRNGTCPVSCSARWPPRVSATDSLSFVFIG